MHRSALGRDEPLQRHVTEYGVPGAQPATVRPRHEQAGLHERADRRRTARPDDRTQGSVEDLGRGVGGDGDRREGSLRGRAVRTDPTQQDPLQR